MSNNRIEKLKEFYQQNPNDPFVIYGLALEYVKTDPDKAAEHFDILLQHHPDYLPTYYHAAALYAEMDQRTKAEYIYIKGIDLAELTNDQHTLRELKNAYTNFQYDDY